MQSTAHYKILKEEKHYPSLLSVLNEIPDGRCERGKRHPLVMILFVLMAATLAGCTNITECLEWATHHLDRLKQWVTFPHRLPDQTTVSRTLAKLDPTRLQQLTNQWWVNIFGVGLDAAASLDGKALRALSGMNLVNHVLNLFTHKGHRLLGQIGIHEKVNEITMSPQLIREAAIGGLTITADALLTQVKIAQEIIAWGGDYLLMVKGNKPELWSILESGFNDLNLKKQSYTTATYRKTRTVTTTVELSHDFYLEGLGYPGLQQVGKITREGLRIHKGNQALIHEVAYFLTSRVDLTSKEAYRLIRNHWSIENNLHWEKDHVFREDQHRLHLGHAPQVMTYLRSLALSFLNQLDYQEISKTIRGFMMSPQKHFAFLQAAHII